MSKTVDKIIHINKAFKWWVEKFYQGNQTKASEALEVSRASINGFMNSDSANPSVLVFMKAYELHADRINKDWWFTGMGLPDTVEKNEELEKLREQNKKLQDLIQSITSDLREKSKNLL